MSHLTEALAALGAITGTLSFIFVVACIVFLGRTPP